MIVCNVSQSASLGVHYAAATAHIMGGRLIQQNQKPPAPGRRSEPHL